MNASRSSLALYLGAPALAAVLATLGGCVTVRPWQREVLAKEIMQLDPDAADVKLREHVLCYREGSVGALGSAGGGCGCD